MRRKRPHAAANDLHVTALVGAGGNDRARRPGFGHAYLRRQASVAVRAQIDASVAGARAAIARALASGADPQAPAPAATCRLASENGCDIEGSSTTVFTSPAPSPSGACANGGCSIYEQANDSVAEGRIGATIDARAIAANGATLASRTVAVTFRTMRVAPYAIVAGRIDETVEALAGSPSGDDGGAAPDGAAPGTLIDVLYENRTTGSTLPANVWRSQIEHPGTTPLAWSP